MREKFVYTFSEQWSMIQLVGLEAEVCELFKCLLF